MDDTACYCRVSTKKEEQALSLDNQKRFFEEFTKRKGIDSYRLYVDEGISAKSMKKRDNFNKMVEDARKGLIKRILVKDISRFARNTYDFLGVIRELKAINVKVEFVTYNMTTEDSEFTLTILAAVAQEESAALSRRVMFGKREGAKNGRVPSQVYGYSKNNRDKYSMDIIPHEANVVKRVFELYTKSQMSTYQIASLLNKEGIPTKRGGINKWSQTVISAMLQNRLYIGQVANGKSETIDFISGDRKEFGESEWIIVERPEFRIVSDEIWNKANAIRRSRSNAFSQFEDDGQTKRKRPSVKHSLSNLLVCDNDNYSFRRRHRIYESGNEYKYWTCSKRDLGANVCGNKVRMDEEQMTSAIAVFLYSLFDGHGSIRKRIIEKARKEINQKYAQETDVKSLKAERRKLLSDREKLMNLFLCDSIDKEYLTQKMSPIEKRIDEIKKTIEVFENQDCAAEDIEKCLLITLDKINTNSTKWLDNAFLKCVFEKFIIHSDGKIDALIKADVNSGTPLTISFGELVDAGKTDIPK